MKVYKTCIPMNILFSYQKQSKSCTTKTICLSHIQALLIISYNEAQMLTGQNTLDYDLNDKQQIVQ